MANLTKSKVNGAIQHLASGGNTLAYPSGDDHPSIAGDIKATAESLPLLNIFYHRWKDSQAPRLYFYLPMYAASKACSKYFWINAKERLGVRV